MTRIYLCKTNEIQPGRAQRFDLEQGLSVALFHTEKGWLAIENRCPHAGGTLVDGIMSKDTLMCIWHGWKFNVKTGECLNAPGDSLRIFPLDIEDEAIYLIPNEEESA